MKRILADRRKKWEADQLAKFEAAGKTPPKGWEGKYEEPASLDVAKPPKLAGTLVLGKSGYCVARISAERPLRQGIVRYDPEYEP